MTPVYLPVHAIVDIFDLDRYQELIGILRIDGDETIVTFGVGQIRFLRAETNTICRFVNLPKGSDYTEMAGHVAHSLAQGDEEVEGAIVIKALTRTEAETLHAITDCPLIYYRL